MNDKETSKQPSQDAVLPYSRFELLKETLHYRFFDFVIVSLLAAVFWIPLIGWLVFCLFTGFLDFTNFYSLVLIYGVAIPLLGIASLGMAGLFYFSKKLAWSEGASLPSDFFEGIARNWRPFLGNYLIIGCLYLILHLDIGALQTGSLVSGWLVPVLSGLSYAAFFLFLLALFFVQTQTILYTGSPFRLFANGIRFVFGAILTNIPMFLAFFAFFLLFEFLPLSSVFFIVIAVEGLFYGGFSAFFFTTYSHSLFDKSINRHDYPDLIRKGLRK